MQEYGQHLYVFCLLEYHKTFSIVYTLQNLLGDWVYDQYVAEKVIYVISHIHLCSILQEQTLKFTLSILFFYETPSCCIIYTRQTVDIKFQNLYLLLSCSSLMDQKY